MRPRVTAISGSRKGLVFAACITGCLLASAWATPRQKKAVPLANPAAGHSGMALMPQNAIIDGSYGFQTLSAVVNSPDGSALEVTGQAVFQSSNPLVAKVVNGVAVPVGDGQADISATYGGQTARTKVSVRNVRTDVDISFANDITPILIKGGCINSACHGAANGQGGLKLSFFGYEPDKDREAIFVTNNGRRVNKSDPATSMVVLKPGGVIPHGGGKRFAKDGPEFKTLVAWVKAGGPVAPKSAGAAKGKTAGANKSNSGVTLASTAPSAVGAPAAEGPVLESVSVWPAERTVRVGGSTHQLLVTANYSDGSTKDVTPLARYFSDDDGIASLNSTGRVTASRDGEANVMVRY